jgi:hypothetical protein
MTLNKAVGTALDRIKQELSDLKSFSRLKVSGPELRRFFHQTEWLQRETCFYRDKWWNKEGGILHAELFCLVSEVQLALTGSPQSLDNPDYAIPFEHFQYGISTGDVERSWPIRSLDDLVDFEACIRTWLNTIALPWFEQFESMEGVIRFLERQEHWLRLALLLNALEDSLKARGYMATWLSTLPRQIESQLDELTSAGLLCTEERKELGRASLQEEGCYRAAVERWITRSSARMFHPVA